MCGQCAITGFFGTPNTTSAYRIDSGMSVTEVSLVCLEEQGKCGLKGRVLHRCRVFVDML